MNKNIKNIIQTYLLVSLEQVKINKHKSLIELENKTEIINDMLNKNIYYDKYYIKSKLNKYYTRHNIFYYRNKKHYSDFWTIISILN